MKRSLLGLHESHIYKHSSSRAWESVQLVLLYSSRRSLMKTVFGRNWGLYVTRCWEKMAQFPQMLPYTIVWKNTVIDYQISGLYLLVRKFVIHPIWSHCSCVGSAVKNISCSLRRFEANWQDLNLRHWNKTRIKITFGPCQGKCI